MTRKKIEGIRKEYICHFTSDCYRCSSKNICISATSFCNSPRRYFFYRLGLREKETPAMLKGRKRHKEALEHLQTIEQYRYENVRKDLFKGKVIKLQEAQLCSPRFGFRGVIDELNMYMEKDKINLRVKEYKSSWDKKYFNQIAIYGLMLSDPQARIVYEIEKRKKRRISRYLYPQLKRHDLNIDVILEVFGRKPYLIRFMENNLLSEWGNGMSAYMMKLAKKFRALHKLNYYRLADLPLCAVCHEYCGYRDECARAPYKIEGKKTKQRYFGKMKDNNLKLIKTKPVINLARI